MIVSVSVLIDTYNHEKYIETAIRSVLQQEELGDTTLEIVVVDDGSTDRAGELIQRFGNVGEILLQAKWWPSIGIQFRYSAVLRRDNLFFGWRRLVAPKEGTDRSRCIFSRIERESQ